MYMPTARILHLESNVTYIPLTRVGGFALGEANFKTRVGGNLISSLFRYQHVGIGNAKLWHWLGHPTSVPNTNGFASQWNIGSRMFYEANTYLLQPLCMVAAMSVSVQYLQKFDMTCGIFNLW